MGILMNRLSTAIVLLCFLTTIIQAQTYTLEQTVVAGGGMSGGAGSSYALDSTTGQAAAGGPLQGNPFAMTLGFWNYNALLAPTAANASISGRVLTANGQGIRNTLLVLTDNSGASRYAQTGMFGYFRFEDVAVGETYILTVYAKRFRFAQPSQVITLTDDSTDVNFIADSEPFRLNEKV